MTQPSPQDDLPPDLTELARHLSELGDDDPLGGPWSQRCYDAARAIAAIPEMRTEIGDLKARLKFMRSAHDTQVQDKDYIAGQLGKAQEELERLRAEIAKLRRDDAKG